MTSLSRNWFINVEWLIVYYLILEFEVNNILNLKVKYLKLVRFVYLKPKGFITEWNLTQ